MRTEFEFFQHAIDCGINMTGKLAIPLFESVGRLVMVDLIHPETRETIIPSGVTMDIQLIEICEIHGIDYVIVYKHAHTPSNFMYV
jgi:hypothetical protein